MISLIQELQKLHYKDPSETEGLAAMIVPFEGEPLIVGYIHRDCLPAVVEARQYFDSIGKEAILFSRDLHDFESRTEALRAVINNIDQNPDIFGEPTKYSLDDYRPIPNVSNPLLAISRPYCRKGFSVPTDCGYMLIRREGSDEILFTKRAEKIGVESDVTAADNYVGKFDTIGGAHVFDREVAHLGAAEVYFDSLLKRANQKVGIVEEDILSIQYLGTTSFQHTRGNRVFHHERHQGFLVTVSADWAPKQNGNDVATAFWASPDDALKILHDQPVEGFERVQFNNNARASTVTSFMSPTLGIITPESVGQDIFQDLETYYTANTLSADQDPVFQNLADAGPSSKFSAPSKDL